MAVEVRTTKYQFAHGHTPRGFGAWAFDVGGQTVFVTNTFTEARRAAIRMAREAGVASITVLP